MPPVRVWLIPKEVNMDSEMLLIWGRLPVPNELSTVARAKIMDWEAGSHASTFGGNPVSCAAAIAVMDTMGPLLPNAREVGARAMERFQKLAIEHPTIGDVRGLGLMIGVSRTSCLLRRHVRERPDDIFVSRQIGEIFSCDLRHAEVEELRALGVEEAGRRDEGDCTDRAVGRGDGGGIEGDLPVVGQHILG